MRRAYQKLIESTEYKEFISSEEGFVLAHASIIKEQNKKASWEFGFYHSGRDRIVVFETEPIKRLPEQEVFKGSLQIKTLNMEEVQIDYPLAMAIVEQVMHENFKSEQVTKHIVILQNLHKQVWNITLVTRTFNIINIKIDAATGEVLSTNKNSILNLGIRNI